MGPVHETSGMSDEVQGVEAEDGNVGIEIAWK